MMNLLIAVGLTMVSLFASAQSSFALLIPVVRNNVTVRNNYGPARDIQGSVLTTGAMVYYSVQPTFLRNKKIFLNLGVGFLTETFTITRPFHYGSPSQVLFYTRDYSYSNFAALAGLRYHHLLARDLHLNIGGAYYWLNSFRQQYTPGSGADQIKTNNFSFGFSTTLSLGVDKRTGRFSYGLDFVVPVYSRWRKDSIFEDNPSEHFSPKAGIGANILISYSIRP